LESSSVAGTDVLVDEKAAFDGRKIVTECVDSSVLVMLLFANSPAKLVCPVAWDVELTGCGNVK
jgi:hypothetical protein